MTAVEEEAFALEIVDAMQSAAVVRAVGKALERRNVKDIPKGRKECVEIFWNLMHKS